MESKCCKYKKKGDKLVCTKCGKSVNYGSNSIEIKKVLDYISNDKHCERVDK